MRLFAGLCNINLLLLLFFVKIILLIVKNIYDIYLTIIKVRIYACFARTKQSTNKTYFKPKPCL